MNKSKAIASAYKNGYLKTLSNEQDVRTAVKKFIEKSKDRTEAQETVILCSESSGVRIFRNSEGTVITELVNF